VYLFKDSIDPFLALLNEHGIQYRIRQARMGVPMAGPGDALEILGAIGKLVIAPSVAAVVVAYLGRFRGRKVIFTTRDGRTVHAEGLPPDELVKVIELAQSLAVINTGEQSDV
jgi:hypothetical protein